MRAYSLAMLAVFYWLMDVKGWRAWAFPLRVVGLNSITIYLLQEFVDVTAIVKCFLGDYESTVHYGLRAFCTSDASAAVVFWLGYVAICWLTLWFLYRHKVFLKV